MYAKMVFVLVSVLLGTRPWIQLLCLCAVALVILIWVLLDKPYRCPDGRNDGGMSIGDKQMVLAQALQLLSYGVVAICLLDSHSESVELFATLAGLVILLVQMLALVPTIWDERRMGRIQNGASVSTKNPLTTEDEDSCEEEELQVE